MKAAALSLIYAVICGAALGVVYDLVRFVRVLFHIDVQNPFAAKRRFPLARAAVVAVGDLFFFAVAAVTMCVFFFFTNDGRVRVYALCGAFSGFCLYYRTVGALFIRVVEAVADFVRRTVRKIARALAKPIRVAAAWLKSRLSPLASRARNVYNKSRVAQKAKKQRKQAERKRRNRTDLCRNGAPQKKE